MIVRREEQVAIRLGHGLDAIRGGWHNGPGWRVSLWTQGCSLRCTVRCLNPHLLSPDGGQEHSVADVLDTVAAAARRSPHPVEGITLLGGEPTDQPEAAALLFEGARSLGLATMLYSGHSLPTLRAAADPRLARLLGATDLLVDGPFVAVEYDERLAWRGSRNQTLHCLTDRYTPATLDAAFARQRKSFSLLLDGDGGMSVSGLQQRSGAVGVERLLWPGAATRGGNPEGDDMATGNGTVREVLIIGPTRVGKTALLSSLQTAALGADRSNGFVVRVFPTSELMKALFFNGAQTIEEGRPLIQGTMGVDSFDFDLEAESRNWIGLRQCTKVSFSFLDGPGGALIGDEWRKDPNADAAAIESYRRTLITRARTADGFMLCVDPTDRNTTGALFRFLPHLLASIGLRPLPYRRVVVALTKADRHFSTLHRDAHGAARATSPYSVGRGLLSAQGLTAIADYCPGAQIGFVWVSAFGFVSSTGEANYNPETEGLLVHGADLTSGQTAASWRPFQVLDPFVFLATGRLGNVELVQR